MDLNLHTYDREVYHALDWIGDMGGLFDGLRGFFAIIVAILTYKKYDVWMVAQLYQQKIEEPEKDKQDKDRGIDLLRGLSNYFKQAINDEYMNPTKVSSLKMLFFDSLSNKRLR